MLRAFWSVDDLIFEIDFDVLHVCMPNVYHLSMTKVMLLRGKHIVCEKPLTLRGEESTELVAPAESNGRVHAVCSTTRSILSFRRLLAACAPAIWAACWLCGDRSSTTA